MAGISISALGFMAAAAATTPRAADAAVGPHISLVTLVNGQDSNEPPGFWYPKFDVPLFTYIITNDGDETLTNMSLFEVGFESKDIDCIAVESLAPGEVTTCTGNGGSLIDASGVLIQVNATSATSNTTVSDQDPAFWNSIFLNPTLEVMANGLVVTGPDVVHFPAGTSLRWTYRLTVNGWAGQTYNDLTIFHEGLPPGSQVNCGAGPGIPISDISADAVITCEADITTVAIDGSYNSNVTYEMKAPSTYAPDGSLFEPGLGLIRPIFYVGDVDTTTTTTTVPESTTTVPATTTTMPQPTTTDIPATTTTEPAATTTTSTVIRPKDRSIAYTGSRSSVTALIASFLIVIGTMLAFAGRRQRGHRD